MADPQAAEGVTRNGAPNRAPPSVDGRRARGERSRDAVLDAVLDLYREGELQASVDRIAERAGVSRRSVFRHFDDLETLRTAALERHLARVRPLADGPPVVGGLGDRIEALVERRRQLYEEITPSRLVTQTLRGKVPVVDERLAAARTFFRDQLEALFAEELPQTRSPEEVLLALEAVTSWEHWYVLRADLGCDPDAASAIVARTLRALLGGA